MNYYTLGNIYNKNDWSFMILKDSSTSEYYVHLRVYTGTDKEHIYIPAEIDGIPVKEIRNIALKMVSSTIKTMIFDKECRITCIPEHLCSYCTHLQRVELHDAIQKIDVGAFLKSPLKYINTPRDLEYIADRAFYECDSLTSFPISSKTRFIGQYAFAKCNGPFSVILPDSVQEIGNGAFSDTGISSLDMSKANINSVPESICGGCLNLISVWLNPDTETIGKFAFSDCVELRSVMNTKNIKDISSFAFSGCDSLLWLDLRKLEHISIPNFTTSTALKINASKQASDVLKIIRFPSENIKIYGGSKLRLAVQRQEDDYDER